jgi:hypothetical protein
MVAFQVENVCFDHLLTHLPWRWSKSVAPLRLGFPDGVDDAEATTLQQNNFSQLLPFSDGDLLRRQR